MEIIKVKKEFAAHANINHDQYVQMYKSSVENPEHFWAEQGARITWHKHWQKVKETSFNKPVSIKWYLGGELNASYNCIDRHLHAHKNKTALLWESDDPQKP